MQTKNKVPADLDPSTWDELSSEMELPNDTQFVVVSLSARKPDQIRSLRMLVIIMQMNWSYLSFDRDHLIGPI